MKSYGDIMVDRPVDQSHLECNKVSLVSHLKCNAVHFSLTQIIENTQCASLGFKHKSTFEAMVLVAIAYSQPVTRSELSKIFGREVSRDVIASLRSAGFIASGPRSPTPGAPYTYVTSKHFLSAFGMETLRDLPDIEALEDSGVLDARIPLGNGFAEESPEKDE